MRLVTFEESGARRLGALVDNGAQVVDLEKAHGAGGITAAPALASMQALIESGETGLDQARAAQKSGQARRATSSVRLLAPLPLPPQMRDFLCFEQHLLQGFDRARRMRAAQTPDPEAALKDMEAKGILAVPKVWYERPIYYKPSRFAVCGTGQDVVWPAYSQTMDYELEFACVIGKAGRDISKDNARQHIFGYTIFNDLSARDEQFLEMPGQLGPGKGKDFDNSNVLGPCITTADEIPDPYALTMIARVNGEEWGRGNSSGMGWKYEDCIAHVSRGETLHPGEILCSGTVGNGCGLELGKWLKAGDVIELEVEKIGVLRNKILRA